MGAPAQTPPCPSSPLTPPFFLPPLSCSKAAARFTEALNRGEAAGLIQEMRLNPTGPGVEPFLNALQASADEEAKKKEGEGASEDKMDES